MTQIDKTTKLATAELVMAKLDDLVIQRQAFQAEYDKVNDTLFGLLSQCLEAYLTTKGGKAEKEVLDAIKKTFTARGIKIEPYTTVLNLIVHYVFDVKNKRINSYVRVLSCAIQKGETPATFADYVKSFGEIEEVVFKKGAKPETQLKRDIHEAQVLVVEDTLSNTQVLATVAPSHLVKPEETAEYTLLIGRTLLSGETEVLAVVPKASSTMIKQAIAKIADAEIEYAKTAAVQSNTPVTQAPVMQVPVAPEVLVETQAPVIQAPATMQVPVATQTHVTGMDVLVIQAEGLTTSVGSVVSANAVVPTINVVSANDITPNLVGIAA